MSYQLVDALGRRFPYLRLSITDVCNFSCQYCLPNGYRCHHKNNHLSLAEIKQLTAAFAALGTWKIRLTGGEPTLRRDLTDIIKAIKATPGIKQIAMTTNGYRLKNKIKGWVNAGLTHLNVSVDSVDPKLFSSLTGHNRLTEILEGIDFALGLPLKKIKLNAVLLKNVNSHLFDEYARLLKHKKLSMRFIELMQTGDNFNYFNQHHVSAQVLKNYLTTKGWTEKLKDHGAGPALEYIHPDYQGSFGIIAPYSKDFCDSCNRLRVSATGDFHLCLFGKQGHSIRHLLQHESQCEALKQTLCRLLGKKRQHHFLHEGDTGITPNLAFVGG